MKKNTKKQLILKIVLISVSIPLIVGIFIGLAIGNHIAFDVYANNLTEFFNQGGGEDPATSETIAKGNDLSRELVREGAVLVKNENNTLPLSKSNNKVNVFGYNSVDWFYSGSGSGQVYANGEKQYNICLALENNGISYNKEIYDYYYNYLAPRGAGSPTDSNNPWSIGTTSENFCVLVEPDLPDSIKNNAKTYSDTAIVTLSRKGGETEDLPLKQYKYNRPTDASKTYLEASDEEIALLTFVGANFDKVIVLVNSTNVLQLDFLESIPGLDSCLIVGNTGNFGANGIYDVLYGDYSPSGKLTDTYPYDLKTNITYFHGGYETTGQYQNANPNTWPYNRNY